MTSDTIELVERVRRHLSSHDSTCEIAGPAPEAAIEAAEEALGCTFPPSYRRFLATFGGIQIPTHLGVVHDFVGVSQQPGGAVAAHTGDAVTDRSDVVAQTLRARSERKLSENLVVVGMGAQYQEWFCLDTSRQTSDGECPILLFDARDNALDQQFYDDFGQMLQEVMGFVADSLEQPLD
jgi:hypothetical protein